MRRQDSGLQMQDLWLVQWVFRVVAMKGEHLAEGRKFLCCNQGNPRAFLRRPHRLLTSDRKMDKKSESP